MPKYAVTIHGYRDETPAHVWGTVSAPNPQQAVIKLSPPRDPAMTEPTYITYARDAEVCEAGEMLFRVYDASSGFECEYSRNVDDVALVSALPYVASVRRQAGYFRRG
jgi:hypothetical protein